MIGSSFYALCSTAEMDPKCLRQNLCITEDQLKILNSLPEWSNGDKDGKTHNLIKDTEEIHNYLISQPESEITSSKHKENVELFDKYLKERSEVLHNCQFVIKKRNKSFSDFDDLKVGHNLKEGSSITRTFSTSNISTNLTHLSSEKSINCDKELSSFQASKAFSDSLKKSSEVHITSNSSEFLVQTSPVLSQCFNKGKNTESMEVIAALPDTCTPTNVEVSLQKSSMQQVPYTKDNDFNQNNSDKIEILVTNQQKSGACCESGVTSLNLQSCVSNLEQGKIASSIATSFINVNSFTLSNASDEIPRRNASTSDTEPKNCLEEKKIDSCSNITTRAKAQHIEHTVKGQNVVDVHKEISSVAERQESISDSSSKHIGESNVIQLVGKFYSESEQHPSGHNSENLKRKSESRRSAKKHKSSDKKRHNLRSIKKAANISFSKEEIENMLGILKKFL